MRENIIIVILCPRGDDYENYATEMTISATDKKRTKKLMKRTFPMRRKWILDDLPCVSDVLRKFPHMKEYTLVGCLFRII